MQKTIERTLPAVGERPMTQQRARNRKWTSFAAVAVLGAATGLGLSALSGGDLTPQEIAEIRAEQMVQYRASQWATQNAPTPGEIAALRYSQYPDAYRQIWESQQP
jgi:hypothetical protein